MREGTESSKTVSPGNAVPKETSPLLGPGPQTMEKNWEEVAEGTNTNNTDKKDEKKCYESGCGRLACYAGTGTGAGGTIGTLIAWAGGLFSNPVATAVAIGTFALAGCQVGSIVCICEESEEINREQQQRSSVVPK